MMKAKENSKILITGGAGFIGSQFGLELTKKGLKKDEEVILLDNLSFGHLDNLFSEGSTFGTFICKDIRDTDLNQTFQNVDTIFHFAGISALPVCQSNPGHAIDVNVAGTANVLEAARLSGVRRVIFSSTSATYELSEEIPMTENLVVGQNLIYSLSKAQGEQICRAYADNFGMDIIVCRFFNIYGPHQDFHRKSPPFTSYIARELAYDRQPILFNNSDVQRDYVHISDVIELLLKMIASEKTYRADIFNVASGHGHSVPEIYKTMQEVSGKNIAPLFMDPIKYWDAYPSLFAGTFPMNHERIKKEVFKHSIGDVKKTSTEFGWTPKINLQSGLVSIYQYAQNQIRR